MDVISLSKASKTLKEIIELNNQTIGQGAEGHFKTVDHRLDWIEGQTDKSQVKDSKQIDLSKGIFENTEYESGSIKLRETGKSLGYTDNIFPIKTLSTSKEHPWSISASPGESGLGWLMDRTTDNVATTTIRGLPAWIKLDSGEGFESQITKIVLTSGGYGWPYNWKFEASQTGEFSGEEVILYENKEEPYVPDSESKEFVFENESKFRFYRIYASQTYSYDPETRGNRIALREIEAMEPSLISTYFPQGSWTSPAIDLGIGWKKTNVVDILKQESKSTSVEIQISTSQDGVSFTDSEVLDESNPPQARYLIIKAILSAAEDTPIEDKTFVFDQTPVLKGITFNYNELSIEGRMKELEEINAINMNKLNFKANALLKSEKYKLHDLVVDTLESDSMIGVKGGTPVKENIPLSEASPFEEGYVSKVKIDGSRKILGLEVK